MGASPTSRARSRSSTRRCGSSVQYGAAVLQQPGAGAQWVMGPSRAALLSVKACVLLFAVSTGAGAATLDDAQRLFYTALFEESAAAAKTITDAEPENLAAWEV